ncbi:hypothetical protein PG985_005760 [Apiospora marii]|uniref:uncharacterized protein n=1 Tax=Apiospora marii TaxID=335849 RepID=UPI003130F5A2
MRRVQEQTYEHEVYKRTQRPYRQPGKDSRVHHTNTSLQDGRRHSGRKNYVRDSPKTNSGLRSVVKILFVAIASFFLGSSVRKRNLFFQIIAVVYLLLYGALELFGKLLNAFGLGGWVNVVLGGLSLNKVLDSLDLGGDVL